MEVQAVAAEGESRVTIPLLVGGLVVAALSSYSLAVAGEAHLEATAATEPQMHLQQPDYLLLAPVAVEVEAVLVFLVEQVAMEDSPQQVAVEVVQPILAHNLERVETVRMA
jgi:hypothetical protein